MSTKPLIAWIFLCFACTVATAAILGFFLDISVGTPTTFYNSFVALALVAIAGFAISPDKLALAQAGCNGLVFGLALFLTHLYTSNAKWAAGEINELVWHAHILRVGFVAFTFVGVTAAAGWSVDQGVTMLVRHYNRSKIRRR